jgi:hypothetical protein
VAGIVGLFGEGSCQTGVEQGLTAMVCGVSDRRTYLGGVPCGQLGVVARRRSEYDFHVEKGAGLMVVVHGFPLVRCDPWRRLDAAEVARRYADGGVRSLCGVDGFFVLGIVDATRQRAFVVNDRCGSIPMFWAASDRRVAIAPEGKALLRMLRLVPRVDEVGLIQLVNSAHPFGERTLFGDVSRIPPAQVVEIDLVSGSVTGERYWKPTVTPDRSLATRSGAASALFEAIQAAQQAVALTGAQDVAVALTGGFDSRIVLATLDRGNGCSYRSFSWGVEETLPQSDPAIARDLAAAFGVPHDFLPFSAASVSARAEDWVYASELLSANMGYFAAGRDFLQGLPLPELVLTGDHLIGLSAVPRSVKEAIEIVTSTPVDGIAPSLLEVATPDAASHVRQVYSGEVRKVVEQAPSSNPKAVQDHLYLQVHAPGWLFSPGFFKEPAATVFRPLMMGTLLDLVGQMPASLRSDKTVLVHMLRKHLPAVARFPVASAFSLIDWGHEALHEPTLNAWLERYTSPDAVCSTPLWRLLDHDRFLAVRSRLFSAQVAPASRAPTYLPRAMEVRRLLARSPLLGGVSRALDRVAPKGVFGRPAKGSHVATFRLLARVALVSLFCEAIDSGRFGGTSPSGSGRDGNPS